MPALAEGQADAINTGKGCGKMDENEEKKQIKKKNLFPDPYKCPHYKFDPDKKDLRLTLIKNSMSLSHLEEGIEEIYENRSCKFCKNYEPVMIIEKIELGSKIFFICAKKT